MFPPRSFITPFYIKLISQIICSTYILNLFTQIILANLYIQLFCLTYLLKFFELAMSS